MSNFLKMKLSMVNESVTDCCMCHMTKDKKSIDINDSYTWGECWQLCTKSFEKQT